MREYGATTELCAASLGVSASTVRRSCKARQPPSPERDAKSLDLAACQRVRSIVRQTHGLVGAQGLSYQTGVPRRRCAELKRNELRELERERRANCATVLIAEPGVVRGFDAMHVEATEGKAYWLVAADAAVPYRTTIATVPSYDAEHVMRALVHDFETYGVPLVLRLDRISCQRTPELQALLTRYQVLALHGPPRHPYYYGQLERQNREHRAWYDRLGPERLPIRELARAGEAMRTSLNTLWPRPTLDGWTAEQAWRVRKTPDVDRRELCTDVQRQASGLIQAGVETLRARRIAIESALTQRGLLTINQGGWC